MLAAGRLDYRNSSPWCYELSLAEGGGCLKRLGNCRWGWVGQSAVEIIHPVGKHAPPTV
ncbi:hypothetical protein OIU84_004314 [Salix udensis]|uniref:Uncharacterized protein n=1 Tax=Salix udensis TaxID=889485 RepID=A0AAD6K3Z0_9ROSI|nr:hypothetical protein OIU84_004314 [Salix udensis]